MSWSYRSDRSDEVYTPNSGPTLVAGSPVTDSPGASGGSPKSYAVDGAIDIRTHTALLTKGSAGAYSVAAPTVDGTTLTIIAGSNFAHVVTFTGSTLLGGVAAKITWTSAAFIGSTLVVQSSGGKWVMISMNLGTLA